VADAAIIEGLPPVHRLALAYAPRRARDAWLGLLALDARLAQIVRETREPMLGQIRMAWWRERLAEPPLERPRGEPLLAILGADSAALAPLVDGWEALLGDVPLSRESISGFAQGRAKALGGLAGSYGREPNASERVGRSWALADVALHLSHPRERQEATTLLAREGGFRSALPREMRPLVVLHGIAQRDLLRGRGEPGPGTLLTAMRLGIFGR
jgi:phytoene synthase